jgi:hypothetical protein
LHQVNILFSPLCLHNCIPCKFTYREFHCVCTPCRKCCRVYCFQCLRLNTILNTELISSMHFSKQTLVHLPSIRFKQWQYLKKGLLYIVISPLSGKPSFCRKISHVWTSFSILLLISLWKNIGGRVLARYKLDHVSRLLEAGGGGVPIFHLYKQTHTKELEECHADHIHPPP